MACADAKTSNDVLAQRFDAVRGASVALAKPLTAEDAMVQSMPDASPAKWHLAHTTWFFEQFVLGALPGYQPVDAHWAFLFNSYYDSVGPMHARPLRGVLSRPTLAQVLAYRAEVDARVQDAFARDCFDMPARQRIELGLQHEQQHQELLLTDIKHAFWCNPLRPAYRDHVPHPPGVAGALQWSAFDERISEAGAPTWPQARAFAFDNESPRHRVLTGPFELASRPVTNAEYAHFIDDNGYGDVRLWLSEGWARREQEQWTRPLYWLDDGCEFTLAGVQVRDPHAPVCHVSYYEADAYAGWAGVRLPSEFEWERAANALMPGDADNFVERGALHPQAARAAGASLLFGDVWEWTHSSYTAYPGFRPLPGALGEYNGKFMVGQQVLRGGSCASPRSHMRASYRNFFQPWARWQFSGLRLARDVQ